MWVGQSIAEAAAILSRGGLVAFPTETVYGLGADAFNAQAVSNIYTAKGRPPDNPLILHVDSLDAVNAVTDNINAYAEILIKEFWPGPLTLVFNKKPGLPDWIGGHPALKKSTVALRSPSHPIAQALIKASGCVIAAPSANKAGTPSPTKAAHVLNDFVSNPADAPGTVKVEYILDGGNTSGGLESTVVDVSGKSLRVLRPGAVTTEMLQDVLNCVIETPTDITGNAPLSPGMRYRHYAPVAPMCLVCGEPFRVADYILTAVSDKRTGILATEQTKEMYKNSENIFVLIAGNRNIPETIAHNLYSCLRQFDALGVEEIFAEGVDEAGLGTAIMNRLRKAAEGRVVCVN